VDGGGGKFGQSSITGRMEYFFYVLVIIFILDC